MDTITQTVTVTGSGNTVVSAGRDVYQTTIHLSPPPPRDHRNLRNLLAQVRQTWIVDVLDRSVAHSVPLELGMRAVPGEVEQPWARVLEAAGCHGGVLPAGTRIGEAFDAAQRTLLILGEPGSGKTTTLLTLARECIARVDEDPAAPVPVVLNLSTWAGSRASLHEWMVRELGARYRVGRALAGRWLRQQRLLPLLDGLDEVAADRRAACVRAIDDFVQTHGVPGLAVCCRANEYHAVPAKLKVGGAVVLLPLDAEQVDEFLDRAGPALAGLRAAVEASPELSELARTPLMLGLMAVAFGGTPHAAQAFGDAAGPDGLREQVFRRYVDRMFVLRGPSDGEPRERTEASLRWLASGMMRRGESIFAVELLQPAWLTPRQLLVYTLLSRVAGGIALAAVTGAVVCVAVYVAYVLASHATHSAVPTATPLLVLRAVTGYLTATIAIGLVGGLVYAPLDYVRFRRPPPRELRILREITTFLGYVAASVLALGIVALAGQALGRSRDVAFMWTAIVTAMVSLPSFPSFFWWKPGRGTPDGDVSLAGTVRWHLKPAVEIATLTLLAGAIMLSLAGRFQLSRSGALVATAFMVVAMVGYGSWRKDVPPPEEWTGRASAPVLRRSGGLFALGLVTWIACLFPILWYQLGPWSSLVPPLSIAAVAAIVLVTPALFWFGGLDSVLHGSLRVVLAAGEGVPLRLRRVLDGCVHLGLLQRVGGGYIFIHRLLLEHFAAQRVRDASVAPGS